MNGGIFGLSPAATFWVVVSGLALLALVLFSGILLPFAAGFVLAYLFHPIVSGMGRARIPRGAAAFVIVALSMIVLAAFIAVIVPPVATQLGDLIENLPTLYERAQSYLTEHYGHYLQHLTGPQKPGEPAPWSRSGSTPPRIWFPSFRACLRAAPISSTPWHCFS